MLLKWSIAVLLVLATGSCSTPDDKLGCAGDGDCRDGRLCIDGACEASVSPNNVASNNDVGDSDSTGSGICVDADGDGYGVGDTTNCAICLAEARCAEDSDDDDPTTNPGQLETCDGLDNNGDGQVDEPTSCEQNFDCPDETPYIPSCDNGSCAYKPPNQLAGPQCVEPVACVSGERLSPGDECF